MANIEQKLLQMGITLADPPPVSHPILRCKQAGTLLFVSGHGTKIKGKVGADLTTQQGYDAAREAAVHCLEAIRQHTGDLDKVVSFVKVLGMVNAAPDFTEHPIVLNGVSELLIAAFGEPVGAHARSAVGMGSLPNGIAVEVEMVVEVEA
jgi:enamine deaminase RidA (YjgF/YER057c/UK114 family)